MADVDDELLNRVTWKIPNALALVGSRAGDEWNGMTTSWITQVSMEPVLIGVGVDNAAVTHRLIAASGAFTVNLWSADDTKVFVKFSKPATFDAAASTLNGRAVRAGTTGAPIFAEAVAWMDCAVRSSHDFGTPHVLRRRGRRRRRHRRRGPAGGDVRHAHEVRRRQAPLTGARRGGPVRSARCRTTVTAGARGRRRHAPPTSSPSPATTGRSSSVPTPARAIARGAAVVERLVDQPEPVYGVSTGFGALANTVIPAERSAELQTALIRSHAAGMGPEVEREVVRAMMFLRARSLAMGFSGARPVVVETMLAAAEPRGHAGRTRARVARRQRGPGPAGVECPGAARRGRRRACADGTLVDGAAALAAAGVAPLALRAKEGLALINGTDGMLGMLVLALADLDVLLRVADIAGAMSTEALLGTDRAFAADLVAMRPQVGQAPSAANLRRAARRLGDRRQPPPRRRPRPGRLLAALHAAGPRRGARHRRPRPGRSPTRELVVVHRQPGRAARRARRVVRQLPRRARSPPSPTSWPSRSPTSGR